MKRTPLHNAKISAGLLRAWEKRPRKKYECPTCAKKLVSGAKTCREHRVFTEEHRRNLAKANTGNKQSAETLARLSKIRKGKVPWNRGIEDFSIRGENNPAWKGGVSKQSHLIRNSFNYEMWRKAIFRRDFYTCMICAEVGGKLHAHHIKPFSTHPELRLDMKNGITLCENCHKQVHRDFGLNGERHYTFFYSQGLLI